MIIETLLSQFLSTFVDTSNKFVRLKDRLVLIPGSYCHSRFPTGVVLISSVKESKLNFPESLLA